MTVRTLLLLAMAALASLALGSDTQPGERPLATELSVSGPAVSVRAPLGMQYRPGYAFPLQFKVTNPGNAFSGEVFVIEGSSDDGLRSGVFAPISFQPQSPRIVTVPVRAAAISANLSVVLRGSDTEGGVLLNRFRAKIPGLKQLPAEARLILSIGRGGLDVRPGYDSVAPITAKDLFELDWMYESIDMVMVRDESFKDASPAAKDALRRYLLGGGRMLITSQPALQECIAARLLPLESNDIRSTLAWWEQNAGLQKSDILAEKNNRPVYCRLPMGFGQVVFLFPASDETVARDLGPTIFNHPALQRTREKEADLRIQPDRYSAFSFGNVNAKRAGSAMMWMGLGALMLCVILVLCLTSKSRLEAAGLPLGLAALLAVMLAQWFPEPSLVCSRVLWTQRSIDGRVSKTQEWKLIETFRRALEVSASAPENGSLGMTFSSSDDVAESQADCDGSEERLRLDHVWILGQRPAMMTATRTDALQPAEPFKLTGKGEKPITLHLPAAPWAGTQRRLGILARANGTLWTLENIDAPGGFALKRYDSPLAAVQATLNLAGDAAKARAAALSWATVTALRSKRDTLILWGEPQEDRLKSLVELDAANYELASSFWMESSEVRIEE